MKKRWKLGVLALCVLLAGCQAAPAAQETPTAPAAETPAAAATPAATAGTGARPAITLPPDLAEPDPTPAPTSALTEEEAMLKLRLDPDTLELTVLQDGALTGMAGERPVLKSFVGWEIPPCLLKLGDAWKVLLSTAQTGMVGLKEGSNFMDWANVDPEDITMLCGENVRNDAYSRYPESHYWARNYYGVFDTYQDGRNMFFLTHCENKNDMAYGKAWDNSVMPQGTVFGEEDYSGDFGGGWRDYWAAYFGFVSLAVIPDQEQETLPTDAVREHDLGPVIWPAMPYLNDADTKVSDGVRHPSLLVDGEYMYIFYLDGSPGASGGICVARAEMGEDGLPGAFLKYYNGDFTEPALPEGFSIEDPEERSFFYQGSGQSSPLFSSGAPCRFSAAALGDTGYYVGTLELMDPVAATYLTVSRDLVNWGPLTMIPGSQGTGWNDIPLAYPKFYNDELTAQSPVDPAAFRVVGTGMGDNYGGYWYSRVSIEIE